MRAAALGSGVSELRAADLSHDQNSLFGGYLGVEIFVKGLIGFTQRQGLFAMSRLYCGVLSLGLQRKT